jgi:hypothetical protein
LGQAKGIQEEGFCCVIRAAPGHPCISPVGSAGYDSANNAWVDGLFSPDVQLEFTIYLLICNFLALQTEFEDSKNSVRSLLQFVKTKIF